MYFIKPDQLLLLFIYLIYFSYCFRMSSLHCGISLALIIKWPQIWCFYESELIRVHVAYCHARSRTSSHIWSHPGEQYSEIMFSKSKNRLEYLSIFSLRYWISVLLSGFCGKGVIVFSICYISKLLGYLRMIYPLVIWDPDSYF